MAIGTHRKPKTEGPDSTITGTWSSPGMQEESEPEIAVEEAPVRTASYVRCITMVGRYPAGSILPVEAFPYLQNLLDLGAVEYDHEATEQFIAGNVEHVELLAASAQPMPQIIPRAPWINASPGNLLGAKYISILQQQRAAAPYQPAEPKAEPKAELPSAGDPFPDSTG